MSEPDVPEHRSRGPGRLAAERAVIGRIQVKFGFTLKPDHRFDRSVALAQRAETNGFDYGWMFDSHVLWRGAWVRTQRPICP